MLKKLFKKCQHDYEIIDKTILPSAYERIVESGYGINRARGWGPEMFQTKLIIVMKCKLCKDIKESVHENP